MRLVLIAMLLAPPVFAEGEARHSVASAALTASLYLLISTMTGRGPETKAPSLVGAVAMSLVVGIALESIQSMERGDKRLDGNDLAANALGVGLATGLIIAVDF